MDTLTCIHNDFIRERERLTLKRLTSSLSLSRASKEKAKRCPFCHQNGHERSNLNDGRSDIRKRKGQKRVCNKSGSIREQVNCVTRRTRTEKRTNNERSKERARFSRVVVCSSFLFSRYSIAIRSKFFFVSYLYVFAHSKFASLTNTYTLNVCLYEFSSYVQQKKEESRFRTFSYIFLFLSLVDSLFTWNLHWIVYVESFVGRRTSSSCFFKHKHRKKHSIRDVLKKLEQCIRNQCIKTKSTSFVHSTYTYTLCVSRTILELSQNIPSLCA